MEVRTQEILDRAQEFAIEMNAGRNTYFWLGGSDRNIEGDWRWESDGGVIDSAFWGRGQPNDFGNQDCLAMQNDGMIYDYECEELRRFVCKLG